jgi:hypothetical protein
MLNPAPDFAGAKRTYCSSKQAATDLSYATEDITISGKRLAKLPPGARVARVVATEPPWHVHGYCRYRVARNIK